MIKDKLASTMTSSIMLDSMQLWEGIHQRDEEVVNELCGGSRTPKKGPTLFSFCSLQFPWLHMM